MEVTFDGTAGLTPAEQYENLRAAYADIARICDPAKLDEILGLRARGLRSAVIVPLGHRQVDGDWLVNLPKVRRPLEQFVSELR